MTSLSLKIGDREFVATDPADDLCLSDLFDMFKGLVIGHTFTDASFTQTCKEFADEF